MKILVIEPEKAPYEKASGEKEKVGIRMRIVCVSLFFNIYFVLPFFVCAF